MSLYDTKLAALDADATLRTAIALIRIARGRPDPVRSSLCGPRAWDLSPKATPSSLSLAISTSTCKCWSAGGPPRSVTRGAPGAAPQDGGRLGFRDGAPVRNWPSFGERVASVMSRRVVLVCPTATGGGVDGDARPLDQAERIGDSAGVVGNP